MFQPGQAGLWRKMCRTLDNTFFNEKLFDCIIEDGKRNAPGLSVKGIRAFRPKKTDSFINEPLTILVHPHGVGF